MGRKGIITVKRSLIICLLLGALSACNFSDSESPKQASSSTGLGNGKGFNGAEDIDQRGQHYSLQNPYRHPRVTGTECGHSASDLSDPILEAMISEEDGLELFAGTYCGSSLQSNINSFFHTRAVFPLLGSKGSMLVGDHDEVDKDIYLWCQFSRSLPEEDGYYDFYDLLFSADHTRITLVISENIPHSEVPSGFTPPETDNQDQDTNQNQSGNSNGGSDTRRNHNTGNYDKNRLPGGMTGQESNPPEIRHWTKDLVVSNFTQSGSQEIFNYVGGDFQINVNLNQRKSNLNFSANGSFNLDEEGFDFQLGQGNQYQMDCFHIAK